MSNALLEAMSSGLPVIVSTNVGPELVPKDAEFGIRVEPEEEAMQRAMESFRNQADELAHRGRRARDVIMPYSWDAVARQYRDLYRDVLFHESA